MNKLYKICTLVLVMLLLMAVTSNDGSVLMGGNASGVGTAPPVTASSGDINVSSAGTIQLIGLLSGKSIYLTHIHFIAGGTVNVSLVYGTGTNCGTGTTTIDGPMPLVAQTGYSAGIGIGATHKLPASQELCITTDQSVQVGGSYSYSQY